MEHLTGLGHRQIGFITVEPYLFHGKEHVNGLGYTAWAVRGYKQACQQYGLPVICEQIHITKESIENGVLRLLAESPRITAIVTMQESVVTGIIKAVQRKELVVPDEISILGSADAGMAELTTPPLTTVSYHAETAGFQAAKILIEQLEGHQDGEKRILVPFELIVRGSTSVAP
jgi:LacI family repressor for deo operon, udp, cdd, tsx, nupC, and nupG